MCEPDQKRVKLEPPNDDSAARARTEGALALALKNPNPADKQVIFTEDDHKYRVEHKGEFLELTKSTTAIVGEAFEPEPFDGDAVVDKYFGGWVKKGPRSEYWPILRKHVAGELTEAEAKQAIKDKWATAAPLGTKMHAAIELHLNKYPDPTWRANSIIGEHTAGYQEGVEPELAQFDDWMKSDPLAATLVPFRTELSVFYRDVLNDGYPTCAGQIDGLYKNDKGEFVIVDWKRVKPKYGLTRYEKAFRNETGHAPEVNHLPRTKFFEYSMQQSLYSVMMKQTFGWDAGDRLYLLRMHEELGTYQLVKCADLRAEGTKLLEKESARIRGEEVAVVEDKIDW